MNAPEELSEANDILEGPEVAEQVAPEEVDRIIDALTDLLDSVKSQTIREIIEECCCDLAQLVDEIGDEEDLEAFEDAA